MQTYLYRNRVKTYDKRIQNYDNYKGGSAYEEDYKFYAPQKRRMYKWPKDKHEPKEVVPNSTPAQFDEECYMIKRPDVYVPFDVLWEPKPIIGTYPTMKFAKNKEELEENRPQLSVEERVKALELKPTNLLSPAIIVDEIQDEFVRNILIKNTYESDWKKASKYAVDTHFAGRKPYPICTELNNPPVNYKTDINPVIPNKFRRRCRDWDKKQTRAIVDPTAQFWLTKDPIKDHAILAAEKVIALESKKEIYNLIREEKLRLQHDLTIPHYGGFKARCSYGVPLRKANLPVTHPNVSVSEAITTRFAEDILEKKKIEWEKLGM